MRGVLGLAVILVVALVSGCSSAADDSAAAKPDIEALLEAYLPKLAVAYAEDDAQAVEGLAAAREIAAIEKRLRDIEFEGRRLQPTFQSVTVEEVQVWGYANAYVTTQELWDIRTYSTGSDQMLTEQIGVRNRVKYQLKKIDGNWTVLFRTILEQ